MSLTFVLKKKNFLVTVKALKCLSFTKIDQMASLFVCKLFPYYIAKLCEENKMFDFRPKYK